MTHVVTENCIKCKFTDCVDVCPVDCFRAGPNFLVIDPDECIDLPKDQLEYIELNAELSPQFEMINRSQDPLPDADEWNGKPNKRQYLEI